MLITFLEYILLGVLIAADLVASRWMGQQAYSWMPLQATTEAQKVDDLFSFLVAVGAFIFLGIVGIIFYSLIFFRAPADDYSEGHPGRGNWKIEVLWTTVPTLLVIWIACQSFKIYQQINILGLSPVVHLHNPLEAPAYAASSDSTTDSQSKPAAEEIEVIAKQWEWAFRYPNGTTRSELHLPVNESVQLVLHSQDVLHGFYVPEFRLKQDIIPARTITFVLTPTLEGQYRLQDSQFSGTNFALMQTQITVEPSADYHQWLEARLPMAEAATALNNSPRPLFNSGWEAPEAPELADHPPEVPPA